MRLDPFSHDLLFGPEGMCHYWLENYDQAIASFRKIRVPSRNLFYLAATYFKKGDKELALEKLKEAKAITGMDVDTFVDSEPYENKEVADKLRGNLQAIPI